MKVCLDIVISKDTEDDLGECFHGAKFFSLYTYIITKNPYSWQGKVDGLITVYVFLLQNVMPAV